MKAHVEQQFILDELWVWVFRRAGSFDKEILRDGGWHLVPEGEMAGEPSFKFNSEVAEVLSAALGEHLPPNAAMSNHLVDTVGVRDRLLTLVEQLAVPAGSDGTEPS